MKRIHTILFGVRANVFYSLVSMVAGGKPLWYIQIFTTTSTLIFTIFFASVCSSWSGGLSGILADKEAKKPEKFTEGEWKHLLVNYLEPFSKSLSSFLLWANIGTGVLVVAAGAAFGYLLYRHQIRLVYAQAWFGLVAVYSLIWMVTSLLFYVKTEEVAGQYNGERKQEVPPPLDSIRNWGKNRTTSTIVGMVVFPTLLYLFLTFVAYRLYLKLEIYGNDDPERINRDFAPGSWVERKGAAEGGTWEREEVGVIMIKASDDADIQSGDDGMRKRRIGNPQNGTEVEAKLVGPEDVQQGVLVDAVQNDSVTGGWGGWLEDVFDYTF
jgi:hypothetical protein